MRYVQTQIAEIRSDSALSWFGVALAMTHVVGALFWLTDQPLLEVIGSERPAVCWPFFENCPAWRIASGDVIALILLATMLIAISAAFLFMLEKTTAAWVLLTGLFFVKIGILLQDFRLVLNQHYMSIWVSAVFLAVPRKRWVIPRLLVSFYVAAGLLKLNHEWLSGLGLYGKRPFDMPAEWIPAACFYVIGMELIVSFGLLSKRPWLFWPALGQILIFHVGSFWVVGFFYPTLMFLLLSIFPLAVLSPQVRDASIVLGSGYVRTTGLCALALFWIMQAIPHAFPGAPAISGEGRVFALNMFDAPVQCIGTATWDTADGETVRLGAPVLQPRLMCDPILYYEIAKTMCRSRNDSEHDRDFALVLRSSKTGLSDLKTVIDVPSFCHSGVSYSFLRHNPWIHAE